MNRFDVAVVGGGIAGTAAAAFLSEQASVVVLERETTLGYHSTGRSAAVFTECYGEPIVRRLAIASRPFLASPPFEEAIPLLSPRGIVIIATHAQVDGVAASVAEQQALVPSVRRLTSAEAADLCPVLDSEVVAAGVFEPDAMDLDVHALHVGYQRVLRRNGGEIRASAELIGAERRGGAWEIDLGDESIAAGAIVNAAGAWCDVVATRAGVEPIGLTPKRRTAFTLSAPHGHQRWPMVFDFDEQFYFKPEGPSLLASPADTTEVEPQDVRHREEDVALGIERIGAVTTLEMRSVQSAWAGLRSFVADSRPVNGWDDSATGFYWLAGQGGFGIKTSPAMGVYAASMILDGAPRSDHVSLGITPDVLGVERLRS